LEAISASLPDNCGFSRRSSLYLASKASHCELLEREYKTRQRCNVPVERLTSADLSRCGYSFAAPLALRSPVAGEIDSYRLTHALIKRAMNRGLKAYSGTRVVDHEYVSGRGVTLHTKSRNTIRADAVVYASGYEAHEQLDEKLGTLSSTWAFASEPVDAFPGWPDLALIWETARPYIYLRTTPDKRVLMGGADEPYAASHRHKRKIYAKTRELAERFARMFPEIQMRPTSAWAGVFGSSQDGLPYIGRPNPHTPIYYTLGYGGNGITFSVIAAEIITDQLQSRRNSDGKLFRFER
jgi:glycine/D-amino acid oxidase-like deaminating enzyme